MYDSQTYRVKYRDDTVFNMVNDKYVTSERENRQINNEHLKKVIEEVITPLIRKNEVIDALYNRFEFGGSYYKGTKYGKLREFDLNLVMKLPINHSNLKIYTNHTNKSLVKIRLDFSQQMSETWEIHRRTLSSWWTYDQYLDQNKFRSYVRRTIILVLKKVKSTLYSYKIKLKRQTFWSQFWNSSTTVSITITTPDGSKIDVNLVPCLEFENVLLRPGYRSLFGHRQNWRTIPKQLTNQADSNILWSLCFDDQEKDMLHEEIRPVVRMMKKLRDKQGWKCITDYHIETIFYHELKANKQELYAYLIAPKIWLFMDILNKFRDALTFHRLSYYWHPEYDLFSVIGNIELHRYASQLSKLIARIDNRIERDDFVFAEAVLTWTEFQSLRMRRLGSFLRQLILISILFLLIITIILYFCI